MRNIIRKKLRRTLIFLFSTVMIVTMSGVSTYGEEESGVSEIENINLGETYWFDLSEAGIPGEPNDFTGTNATPIPDLTLHWVPFTYVGTINAYTADSLDEAVTEDYAKENAYDHSLFYTPSTGEQVTYHWQRDGQDIVGAAGKTYTLTANVYGAVQNLLPEGKIRFCYSDADSTNAVLIAEAEIERSEDDSLAAVTRWGNIPPGTWTITAEYIPEQKDIYAKGKAAQNTVPLHGRILLSFPTAVLPDTA